MTSVTLFIENPELFAIVSDLSKISHAILIPCGLLQLTWTQNQNLVISGESVSPPDIHELLGSTSYPEIQKLQQIILSVAHQIPNLSFSLLSLMSGKHW